MSETITVFFPITSGITAQNCLSLQLSYTATGGTFSVTLLKDSIPIPLENAQFSLPYGRIATVKNVGSNQGPGGLTDTISGPIIVPAATLTTRVGIPHNVFASASSLASRFGLGVNWAAFDPIIRSFIFTGVALSGIQQLASNILAEVIVNSGGINVVTPGQIIGTNFKVPKTDIVSINQLIDYSLDVPNVLNPALSAAQINVDGDFVYDSDHAQKQPKFTVNCGSPGLQGSTDFIPIPDGWLVEGEFEEWFPPSSTDATNPNSTVTNGRYWKDFPSPVTPGARRGITTFTRLIKQINIPGNVSPFVASPVTGDTLNTLSFEVQDTEGDLTGFTSGDAPPPTPPLNGPTGTTFFDVISNQFYTFPNCISLVPGGGGLNSGEAASFFYSIVMELWTFPRVNPQTFGVGNPVNPFGLPVDAVTVSPPMSNIVTSGQGLIQYWNQYMNNYRLINSPRLRTTLSCVFRGVIPQPGDALIIESGAKYPTAGRIQTVSLNMGRSGLVLNITAEVYQYGGGLFSKYPAIFQV